MTDKENIRAEIEREMGDITYGAGKPKGVYDFCKELLSFIDSLPETSCPKESDDLEKSARLYAIPHYMKDVDVNYLEEYPYDRIAEAAFIAGAEWQKEQDQPITGNSLEQEWLRYVDKKKKECGGELPSLGDYGWLKIARHFAQWQKGQMMKEAVEGEVVSDLRNVCYVRSMSKIPDGLHFGDKVKIIIVKEGL